MEIVEKGETLSEWFLANIHTCHRCKTKFRAGKKAKAGRDYELEECISTRGYVKVVCPHCKVALFLHAPVDPLPGTPYVPSPYPVYPQTWQPWYPGIWYGSGVCVGNTGVGTLSVPAMIGGAFGVVTAQVWNPADTVGALTADATAVKELEARLSGVFEIVVN